MTAATRGGRGAAAFVLAAVFGVAVAPAGGEDVVHTPRPVVQEISPESDIVRFLEQATFGPTDALVAHVAAIGYSAYLDEQFASHTSTYPNLAPMPASPKVGCPAGSATTCVRDNYTMYPLQVRFFQNALGGADQLRQRVALALHEILVVSGVKIRQPSAMAPYLNMLLDDAFANYRTILADLTLNPAMGHYLDMVDNDAQIAGSDVAPNENYAREVMQLFSIGVDTLGQDGTPVLDASGDPVPTYTQDTVEGFAHLFTGWTYAPLAGAPARKHNPPNFLAPMTLYRDARGVDADHDKGAKQLLAYPGAAHPVLAAGQDGAVDLEQGLDNVFGHPNVGPFIGRQLIQHLVTSNPSPAYVERVARAFADNGLGVRGDMRAVIRAILLDPEARAPFPPDPAFGRLREPALFIANVCRAMGASSDGVLAAQADLMGQALFNSPSVFSYYPHSFQVPGTDVQGPEFGIQSSSAAEARINFVDALAFSRIASPPPGAGTAIDFTALAAQAGDPDALAATLDGKLLHATMSAAMRAAIVQAVTAVPASNPLLRAETAFYLVATSAQYQVAR